MREKGMARTEYDRHLCECPRCAWGDYIGNPDYACALMRARKKWGEAEVFVASPPAPSAENPDNLR